MNRRRYGVLGIVVSLAVFLLSVLEASGAEVKLWSDVADTSWLGQHAGTEADPYLIGTPEALAGLAKLVNGGNDFEGKHILLTRDISVAGREWIPIGWMCAYGNLAGFAGTFEGGGHAVRGVTISTGEYLPKSTSTGTISHSASFFGYVSPKGVVKNVTLMGSITNKKSNGVAGVASWTDGHILNCTTSFRLRGSSPANTYVGGIASLNGGGMIRNCVTFGTAKAIYSGGFTYAGGILGFSYWYKGALENCTALCSEVESEMDAGGIVGGFSPMPEIFKYCVSTCGSVAGQYRGGIVGAYGYGWTDCYWLKVNENQPSVGLATAPGSEGMITDPSQLPVASVVLDISDVRTMVVGETRKIRARPYPSTGDLSGLKYRWSASSGLTILSGQDGPEIEVKADRTGFYRVSLEASGVLGVPAAGGVPLSPGAVLKVVDALPPATGIALEGPSQALMESEEAVITSYLMPSDAKPEVLRWSVSKAEGNGASVEDLFLRDHGDGKATVILRKQRKGGASYTVTVQASAAVGTLSATTTIRGAALDEEPNMPGFVPFGTFLSNGAEGKRPFGVTSGLAPNMMLEIGSSPENFRLGGDGLLYPSRACLASVMEKLGRKEGVKLSGASPFPLVSLTLSEERGLSAVGFWAEGKRFRASTPERVALFEAYPDGTGSFFRYAKSPKDYVDGHFAVQHEDGSVMKKDEKFEPEKRYGLVAYVRDGGRLDLNPTKKKLAFMLVLSKSVAISGDVSADVSPDVSQDVSQDALVPIGPDTPAMAVLPKLPDGTNEEICAVKPEFVFGPNASEALQRALKILGESGLERGDLIVDRRTGLVKLNPDVGWDVAEGVLGPDSLIDEVRSLPVLTADLPGGSSVAAVGLELSGAELMSGQASMVRMVKVTGPETGESLKYAGDSSEFGDGCFTVLDGKGRIVEELNERGRYVLTLFIEDGGEFDLDGRVNGRIVDPAVLLSVETQEDTPTPDIAFDPNGGGGGGGCDGGFGFLLLLAVAPAVLYRKR